MLSGKGWKFLMWRSEVFYPPIQPFTHEELTTLLAATQANRLIIQEVGATILP